MIPHIDLATAFADIAKINAIDDTREAREASHEELRSAFFKIVKYAYNLEKNLREELIERNEQEIKRIKEIIEVKA